jgi:DNA-binding transcriptional ArsR family regulator
MTGARTNPWPRALDHPLRVKILHRLLELDSASATTLAPELGVPVNVASYHLRRLQHLGVVVLVRKESVRGAVRYYYRLSDPETAQRALDHAAELATIGPTERSATTTARDALWLQFLGRSIREHREAKGITARKLAATAHTTPTHLRRIEQGAANATASTLKRLGDAMECNVKDFFARAEELMQASGVLEDAGRAFQRTRD